MVNVARALEALDIEYEEKGDNSQALCPMHRQLTGKEDHNPSWYIHMENGQHICFSCGYKGNLQQLVCDMKEFYIPSWNGMPAQYDYSMANQWLAGAIEVSIEDLKTAMAKIPEYIGPMTKPIPMSEARLVLFSEPPQDALDARNVTAEAAKHYEVLWNHKTATWILPIRDPHFQGLMGWQEKGTIDRTFKNRPSGVQKSKTIFGINTQLEELAIVVESPLDCLRIHSAGIKGAISVFGAIVSEEQAKLIKFSTKVIAAFDNPNIDAAGKKGSDQMRIWARKYGINLFFFNYGDSGKKDPGDMTDEEIRWGIENAKSSILGESAYVYGNA